MIKKATYKSKVRDRDGYAVHLFYEYRGHEYMVTDEHNGYSEPMWVKHKYEQELIDKMIERNEHRNEHKIKENAESGLDLFFNEIWDK